MLPNWQHQTCLDDVERQRAVRFHWADDSCFSPWILAGLVLLGGSAWVDCSKMSRPAFGHCLVDVGEAFVLFEWWKKRKMSKRTVTFSRLIRSMKFLPCVARCDRDERRAPKRRQRPCHDLPLLSQSFQMLLKTQEATKRECRVWSFHNGLVNARDFAAHCEL